jgi:hypothetical protein
MPSEGTDDAVPAVDRPSMPSQSMWDANDVVIAAHHRRLQSHPAYEGFSWNGTIPLDDAARKGLILRRIDHWRQGVELQHERLTKSGDRHIPDLHFYVIAADNLADGVKVILKQYPQLAAVQAAVQDALDRYTKVGPDIHDLRNLIEHFEEYDHMVGKLQKSGQLPKQRMGQVENYSLLEGDAHLAIFGKYMRVSTTTPAALPSVALLRAEAPRPRSEPKRLVHQDRRDTAGSDRLIDDQEVIYSAGNAVGLPGSQVFKGKAVLVDASQSGVEIGDDLLTTDNEDDVTSSGDDWTELAPAGRRDQK